MTESTSPAKSNTPVIVLTIALIIAIGVASYFYLQTRRMKTAEPVEVSINNPTKALPKHEVSLIQASEIVANLDEVKEIRRQAEKDPKQGLRLSIRNAKDFTATIDGKKYWTIEVGVTRVDKFELRDTYYVGVHDAEIMLYDLGSDRIIKLSEQRKISD